MSNPEVFEPTFVRIVENIDGSEGPVFDKNGRFYMVAPTKPNAGEVVRVNLENGQVEVVCTPYDGEFGGIPAGCQCDLQNNIWIADMRLGILKMDPTGSYKQMCKVDSTGRTMQGCNDCAFDYDGNLWVTAPAGDIAPAPFSRSDKEPFGSVYCYTRDGSVIWLDGNMQFPNGIAVAHTSDGKPSKLIVAETFTKSLWQYDILEPGKVSSRKLFGKLPGDHFGGPDGMDFDDQGNLIVANHGGSHLEVFSPDGGDPFIRIKCPFSEPSNVHFQPGGNIVYVTEHTYNGLWKFQWKHKGKKQYCEMQ